MHIEVSIDDLIADLSALPPFGLQGLELFQRLQSSNQEYPNIMDVDLEVMREAVSEMEDYHERCNEFAKRLAHLNPVPLVSIRLMEFAL